MSRQAAAWAARWMSVAAGVKVRTVVPRISIGAVCSQRRAASTRSLAGETCRISVPRWLFRGVGGGAGCLIASYTFVWAFLATYPAVLLVWTTVHDLAVHPLPRP